MSEDAIRVARQGAPHRSATQSVCWISISHLGYSVQGLYCVVYIPVWQSGTFAIDDIINLIGARNFHFYLLYSAVSQEMRPNPFSRDNSAAGGVLHRAFLQFGMIDDECTAPGARFWKWNCRASK
jgi:hypothetical protein